MTRSYTNEAGTIGVTIDTLGVWVATRADRNAVWGPPERLAQPTATHDIRIVVNMEDDPPTQLGVAMPWSPDDEDVVRYYDTGPDEEEHRAPQDCVAVITVQVPL